MAPLQRKYDDSFPDAPVTAGDCDFHEVVRRRIYEGSRKRRLRLSLPEKLVHATLNYFRFKFVISFADILCWYPIRQVLLRSKDSFDLILTLCINVLSTTLQRARGPVRPSDTLFSVGLFQSNTFSLALEH